MSYFPPPNSGTWTTGICGCFEDCESCICGYCCPCILIGRYVEILDQGATSCFSAGALYSCLVCWTGCCGFVYTCGYRARLRQKFGLPPSPCGDCLTDYCCAHCSICQVYRELQNRNIDPKLGYNGVQQIYNQPPPEIQMQKYQQQQQPPPPMQQGYGPPPPPQGNYPQIYENQRPPPPAQYMGQ